MLNIKANSLFRSFALVLIAGAPCAWADADTPAALANSPAAKQEAERLAKLPPVPPAHGIHVDHSGRVEKGHASFYANKFANRKMADGRRMNPNANIAASKTLPLGTVAKVTNLENGKSETVKIEDRGPFVDGRVVDLAPKVAADLDIKKAGVAPVVVKPIAEPTPSGEIKLGAGAADAPPNEIKAAVETTKALTGEQAAR